MNYLTTTGDLMSDRDFYQLREMIRKLQRKVERLEEELKDKKEAEGV